MASKIFDLWGDLHEAVRALLMDGVRETGISDEIDHIFIKWHKEGARPPKVEVDEGVAIPELVKLFEQPDVFNEPSGSVDIMSNIEGRLLNLETRIQSLELRLQSQTTVTPPPFIQLPFKPSVTYTPWSGGEYVTGCKCGGNCGCAG